MREVFSLYWNRAGFFVQTFVPRQNTLAFSDEQQCTLIIQGAVDLGHGTEDAMIEINLRHINPNSISLGVFNSELTFRNTDYQETIKHMELNTSNYLNPSSQIYIEYSGGSNIARKVKELLEEIVVSCGGKEDTVPDKLSDKLLNIIR